MYAFPLAVYLVVKLLSYRVYLYPTWIDNASVLMLYRSVFLPEGRRVLVF